MAIEMAGTGGNQIFSKSWSTLVGEVRVKWKETGNGVVSRLGGNEI